MKPTQPSAWNAVPESEAFWDNRFHRCVLAAGFIAVAEGRLDDSLYVRELAYSFYEEGAFRDRVQQLSVETAANG